MIRVRHVVTTEDVSVEEGPLFTAMRAERRQALRSLYLRFVNRTERLPYWIDAEVHREERPGCVAALSSVVGLPGWQTLDHRGKQFIESINRSDRISLRQVRLWYAATRAEMEEFLTTLQRALPPSARQICDFEDCLPDRLQAGVQLAQELMAPIKVQCRLERNDSRTTVRVRLWLAHPKAASIIGDAFQSDEGTLIRMFIRSCEVDRFRVRWSEGVCEYSLQVSDALAGVCIQLVGSSNVGRLFSASFSVPSEWASVETVQE